MIKKLLQTKYLTQKKELSDINYERLEKTSIYIKNNLDNSDKNMYLNTDSLIEINILKIGLNNVTPRKFNVKLYRSDNQFEINCIK